MAFAQIVRSTVFLRVSTTLTSDLIHWIWQHLKIDAQNFIFMRFRRCQRILGILRINTEITMVETITTKYQLDVKTVIYKMTCSWGFTYKVIGHIKELNMYFHYCNLFFMSCLIFSQIWANVLAIFSEINEVKLFQHRVHQDK